MTPSVLLLTGKYDFAADAVAIALEKIGTSYLRINREEAARYQIAINPIRPTLSIRLGDMVATGEQLQAIWFRQPVFLRNIPSRPLSLEEQLTRSQWSAFWRALSLFDRVKWMNRPQATYLAECKPYQLRLAHQCGFNVPQTLVGNCADHIKRAFASKRFIVKSMDTVLLREENECLFTYTMEGDPRDINADTTQSAPLIAQEFIVPKTDIRVTLAGENLWAVKIHANGAPVDGDWRLEKRQHLEYLDHTLPPDICDKCFAFMRALNLNFGAIDLILHDNVYFFIEINPTGEWEWLNSDNRNIASAIAAWLAKEPT